MNKFIPKALLLGVFTILIGCQPSKPEAEIKPMAAQPLWQLDTNTSRLTYINSKNNGIEEHNTLRFHSGTIDANRQVNIRIDLNTIDTSIPIRDERMRELFFETDTYPTAEVTANIENDLPLMTPYNINFSLHLHGHSQSFQSSVIIHSGGGEMMITSAEDVTVSAADFGLEPAIEKLREIAMLETIDPQVRVSFKLHFKQIN